MEEKQKRVLVFGIVSVGVLSIVLAFYSVLQETGSSIDVQNLSSVQSGKPVNTEIEDDTTSDDKQKMYRNSKFNFEFEIPENLIVRPNTTDSDVVLSEDRDGHWVYGIRVTSNEENLSLDQALDKATKIYENQVIQSSVSIDSIPAKRYIIQERHDYGNAGVILIREKNIITIFGDESNPANKMKFDLFLKTIHFF